MSLPIVARLGSSHFDVGGIVSSVAWSPDGQFLATAAEPNTGVIRAHISLWNPRTGKPIWQQISPSPRANPIMFSQDGKLVVERGESGGLAFDAATGKLIDRKPQSESSADGAVRVFRGKENGQLFVEREGMENRPLTISPKDEKNGFTSFRISPDGRWLAAGSSEGEWGLWDTRDGRRIRHLEIPKGQGATLEFAPDSKRLLASGDWEGIYVFRAETGERQHILGAFRGRAALAIDAEGKRMALGYKFGVPIQIWNLETGKKERDLTGPRFDVRAMAFSPDGRRIALAGRTGSRNGPLGIWDLARGKETLDVIGHFIPATKITYSFDGRMVATSSPDRTVCVWNAETAQLLWKLEGDANSDLRFSPDGWMLAASGQGGNYRIWEVSSGELLVESGPIPKFSSSCQSRFSPELDRLAVGSNQGEVQVIETSTGNQLSDITIFYKHEVGALAFSGDGRRLAVGAGRARVPHPGWGHVVLWDLEQNKKVHELKSPHPENERSSSHLFEALEFSPDGDTLASRHSELGIEFWNPAEGARLEGILKQGGQPMAFSPIGQVLVLLNAVGSPLGDSQFSQVELIEVATGGIFQRWNVPKQATAFAISPEGQRLAIALRDSRQVMLLDIKAPSAEAPVTEAALNEAVDSLADRDAPKGRKAMATLIAAGNRSVPILTFHVSLEDRPKDLGPQIQQLIQDLDSNEFFTRERATDELAALGERAVPALVSALKQNLSLEANRRIRMAIKASNSAPRKLTGPALRKIRAIEILERIGTTEARELLKSLTKDSRSARQDSAQPNGRSTD